jgi:translation initiation factor RLI1
MPKTTAVIDYDRCKPERCDPGAGLCLAVAACTRGILTQEAAYDQPFVFPPDMCQGCRDCSRACPLDAIRMM